MHKYLHLATFAGLILISTMLLAGDSVPQKRSCTTDPESAVEVCQITSTGENKISYYDTPVYSARYNKIVYLNKQAGMPPQVVLANPDGSGAEAVAYGMDPVMGPDGQKVYYITRSGPGGPGTDLFAYDLGTHRETRITKLRARTMIQSSPAVHTPKGNLLVYSVDNIAYLIYDDGTGNTQLEFDDPFKSDTFHRLRISPTKPNLIFYNRNVRGASTHPLFVYDADAKKTYKVTELATHMLWAPDGIHIAYNGGPDYHFHMARYDGTEDRVVDPVQREGTAYCTFAPEGDVLACANWDTNGDKYPMPGSIFLLAADGSNRVAYVAKHNAKQTGFWGEPALDFMQDRYNIVFRSDATGDPQVYTARLPHEVYGRLKPPGLSQPPAGRGSH